MKQRRELTPEQLEASKLRRERFRLLAKEISALTDEGRRAMAARMPALFTVEGHPLSTYNACMIAAQKPAATVLGGFQQWRRAGRRVCKGAVGIAIWIPTKGRPAEGEEEIGGVRFTIGYLFDVSDTEALSAPRALPEFHEEREGDRAYAFLSGHPGSAAA